MANTIDFYLVDSNGTLALRMSRIKGARLELFCYRRKRGSAQTTISPVSHRHSLYTEGLPFLPGATRLFNMHPINL
jgi:hypothetical protein